MSKSWLRNYTTTGTSSNDYNLSWYTMRAHYLRDTKDKLNRDIGYPLFSISGEWRDDPEHLVFGEINCLQIADIPGYVGIHQ